MIEQYSRALAVAAVAVFFTDAAVYLSLPETASLNPWYWIAALGAAAAPLFFTREWLGASRLSPLPLWCLGFLLLTSVWLVAAGSASEAAWQELRTRILSCFFVLVALCLLSREGAQVWARRAVAAATVLAVALNLYELFNPGAFSLVAGRSAGLYANPTKSGAALILGMIFGAGVLPKRLRMPYALLVLAGTALTLSRGALLTWPVLVLLMTRGRQLSLRRSLVVGCVALALASAAAVTQWDYFEDRLGELGVLTRDVGQRLEGFADVGQFGADDSAYRRREIAGEAFGLFTKSPLVGYGVAGSAELGFEMGLHNQYLRLMIEHGVAGALVLPLLVLAAAWRARGEARQVALTFAAFVFCWGFFSHNVIEEYYLLLAFALMGAMSAASRKGTEPREEAARGAASLRAAAPRGAAGGVRP